MHGGKSEQFLQLLYLEGLRMDLLCLLGRVLLYAANERLTISFTIFHLQNYVTITVFFLLFAFLQKSVIDCNDL